MARCSEGCYSEVCTSVPCTGDRVLKLERQVQLLSERAQNASTRIAELRAALDLAREDFDAAMATFRSQPAPMRVPLVRKKAE